ncbi:Tumor necrosis factor receptor superfamily member 9 [Merluccius polli]|uniref:Tumor necrosis factor receptor superfamily member 9 n=1 Tax=Merluccius polli TaxID=89951 RepID=A0AA47NXI9_MERPO|nr:Tumor necrosis factor receptor superfamily member 9 [Merluccius polli]
MREDRHRTGSNKGRKRHRNSYPVSVFILGVTDFGVWGNRIFNRCGFGNPDDFCVVCEEGTFTTDPSRLQCTVCRECAGTRPYGLTTPHVHSHLKHQNTSNISCALVFAAACTTTRDTQCGCREGLRCGDSGCTFCVTECGKGQEPDKRTYTSRPVGSCRACPNGTFNDQTHQHCKPWRTMCPHPDEHLIKGDAETDSKCLNPATNSTTNTTPTTMTTTLLHVKPEMEDTMLPWWIVTAACCIILLVPLVLMIKIMRKLKGKKWIKPKELAKKTTKTPTKKPLYITTPTDEPRTLCTPTECSFHEPLEEEEASSSESLVTEDSEGSEGSTRKLMV